MRNKGITLIALIATIVVMIIIAGVAIKMATGDNSAITNAQKATYKNSITQIEQWLNEFYVQKYDYLPNSSNKALAIIQFFNANRTNLGLPEDTKENPNPDNIFHKKNPNGNGEENTKWRYIIDGKSFYCLNTENLKKIANNEVEILEVENDWSEPNHLKGVYGVTADLRVFYIIDWENEKNCDIIGIKKEEIIDVDENEIIFNAGTEWSKLINGGKEVTYENLRSKKKYEINANSGLSSLNGLSEFSNLSSLEIKNSSMNSISGIEGAKSTLKYLWIENPNINDYTGLRYCENLEQLYIFNSSQNQLNSILTELSNGNFPNLKYLGIIGATGWNDYNRTFNDDRYHTSKDPDITSIDLLKNLTNDTKKAVKYMWINNNSISDISCLSGFTGLDSIHLESNNIESLKAFSGNRNIKNILSANNNILKLTDLTNVINLAKLDVRKNQNMEDISSNGSLSNLKSLKYLWFKSTASRQLNDSNIKLSEQDIKDEKDFLLGLKSGLEIDSKYLKYLIGNTDEENKAIWMLQYNNESIKKSDFERIGLCTNLTHFSMIKVTLTDDNGNKLNNQEASELITKVLSKLTKMKYLQLQSIDYFENDFSFLSNMQELLELDLWNVKGINTTNKLDLSVLNRLSKLNKLCINSDKIKLTDFENKINSLTGTGYWTSGSGLILGTEILYKQLEECENITYLRLHNDWRNIKAYTGTAFVDLSGCKSLKTVVAYTVNANLKLPESLQTLSYSHTTSNNAKLDLSKCKNMKSINFTTVMSSYKTIEETMKTLPQNGNYDLQLELNQQKILNNTNFAELINILKELKKLKSFKIYSSVHLTNDLTDISPINKLKQIQTLTIGNVLNMKELPNFEGMNSLKSLSIYTDGGRIGSITKVLQSSNLNTLPNLISLNLSGNQISDIEGLRIKQSNDFNNLTTLHLENNALEDYAYANESQYDEYILYDHVFKPLYNKKLRELYLSGNSFKDTLTQLRNLKFNKKDF